MKKEFNQDTFCPWMYKAVSLEGNQMRPCCRFHEEVLISDSTLIKEYMHGGMAVYREKLNTGEKISSCNQCWQQESIGHKSLRQEGIDIWGYDDTLRIEYLEFSIDNTCNLRCLTCTSYLSTGWIKEEKKIFGKSINDEIRINESIYSDIDLSKIKTVKFLGGEPLMSSAITNISKKLLNQEYLKVQLNTNVTKLPDETVEQLFLNCTHLEINLSIDGIQNLNNFIRYNAKWDVIENNFVYFDSLIDRREGKSTRLNILTTVNAYNVNMLHTIKEYFQINFPRFTTTTSVLRKPEFMAIENLPGDYKEKILPYLEKHNFQEEISFLKIKERNLFNYFVNYHNKLLEIRDIDFSGINPLLDDYIKNFKKQDADFEKIFLMKSGWNIDDV